MGRSHLYPDSVEGNKEALFLRTRVVKNVLMLLRNLRVKNSFKQVPKKEDKIIKTK